MSKTGNDSKPRLCFQHAHGWRSVVTVHGIRDDYTTAWTNTRTNIECAWWVKNEMFGTLDARETDYSYEIDGESMIYEPNGIVQHAQKLITAYAAVRRDLEDVSNDIILSYPKCKELYTDRCSFTDRNRPARHMDLP
jgi:hypothetical protein